MSREQRIRRIKAAGKRPAPKLPEPLSWDDSRSEKIPSDAKSAEIGQGVLVSFDWYAEYEELAQRFSWRIAAYIAWYSSPRVGRRPATQMEFAQLIGLKSDRIIRKWRNEQPEIEQEIKRVQASPLVDHRRDIYEALVRGALDQEKGHQDRKLALELLGDYKAKESAPPANQRPTFTADDAAAARKELADWELAQGELWIEDDGEDEADEAADHH